MAHVIFRFIVKNWYPIIVISLMFVIFYSLNTRRDILASYVHVLPKLDQSTKTANRSNNVNNNTEIKYILLWTNPNNTPFFYFGEGRSVFIKKRCKYTNCYVTSDRNFLGDYTEFEVVAFNGPELGEYEYMNDLPKRRFVHQKYVYANIESAAIYPVCSNVWNGYFNWTWTYKLDSSAVWGYFVVRDTRNNIVGPKKDMHWINLKDMEPINDSLKVSLSSKTKPIAWFVSNCNTASLRENFVRQIQDHLRNYNLDLDIYGDCGTLYCIKSSTNDCFNMIQKRYFFYLAFENSISDDYVTEKVLNALKYNTVPIVFGGANYTRFMPDGAYLDARLLGPKELAKKIFELLHSRSEYFEFFRWKKYYSYHRTDESPESDVYCTFCAMLNDEKIEQTTIYEDFNLWWTPEERCRKNHNETY